MRINRYIASCTDYSRRSADELIKAGRVQVNDVVSIDMSYQVQPKDVVSVDGTALIPQRLVYYVVNKPVGYVSTAKDKHAKKIITDLVPKRPPVFPVGRLDKDSRGLMLLTNDGDLAQQITHPTYAHQKEYHVDIDQKLTDAELVQLRSGVQLLEGLAMFDTITHIKNTKYSVVLHQGWNRQIRRMFGELGVDVLDLQRVRIAGVRLGGLPEGQYVQLSSEKIYSLIKRQ